MSHAFYHNQSSVVFTKAQVNLWCTYAQVKVWSSTSASLPTYKKTEASANKSTQGCECLRSGACGKAAHPPRHSVLACWVRAAGMRTPVQSKQGAGNHPVPLSSDRCPLQLLWLVALPNKSYTRTAVLWLQLLLPDPTLIRNE